MYVENFEIGIDGSARIFWYFEAKEFVKVIEAIGVIMSNEIIEATELFRTP